MHTILQLLELSTDYLNSKNVESPRLNAELLLADVLKCSRMDLYLKYDQPLREDEKTIYRDHISRRGKREPVQYITGSVEFYGLEFEVNKNVLIPRPDTEILIEEILNQTSKEDKLRILDVGTGSGNIPIVLAKHLSKSKITAIDISDNAIELARKNATKNEADVEFLISDIVNYSLDNSKKYDLIVSNPPYIKLQEYTTLEKELLEYEPKNALTDNGDGLSFYKIISEKSDELLEKNGKLFFEVGYDQSEQVSEIMKLNKFNSIRTRTDYGGNSRVVWGLKE